MIASSSGAAIGGLAFLIVLFVLAGFGLWVWGIVDAAKRSNEAYTKAGSNKTLWIVLMVLFGDLAVLIYALALRPKLVAAEGQ